MLCALILPTSRFYFFFNDAATTEIYTLSLHDALPIPALRQPQGTGREHGGQRHREQQRPPRSEEHTSELQSRRDLVCRLLLEKKKKKKDYILSISMESDGVPSPRQNPTSLARSCVTYS